MTPLPERVASNPLDVVGVDRVEKRHRPLAEALARSAPNPFVSRADVKHVRRCHVHHPEDFVDVLGKLPKPLFRFGTHALGLQPVGDVDGDSADKRGLEVGAQYRKLADERMMHDSIAPLQGFDELHARLTRKRLLIVFDKLISLRGRENFAVALSIERIGQLAENIEGRVIGVDMRPLKSLIHADPGRNCMKRAKRSSLCRSASSTLRRSVVSTMAPTHPSIAPSAASVGV